MKQFITHSVHTYFSNINHALSKERESFNMCLKFSSFKNVSFLYIRVGEGAGARAASKFLFGAGAA
jgi:hypothetical protein